jgi:hypothetical protein
MNILNTYLKGLNTEHKLAKITNSNCIYSNIESWLVVLGCWFRQNNTDAVRKVVHYV